MRLLLFVLALLLGAVIGTPLVQPALREPGRVASAARARGPALSRSARYDFAPIRAQLEAHRLELASCLLREGRRDRAETPARVHLLLSWRAQGTLRDVELTPDEDHGARDCVFALARGWRVAPHPAYQPFSYGLELALAGY